MGWTRKPTLFTATVRSATDKELRKLAIRLGRAIITRTPRDTGRAVQGWVWTVSTPTGNIEAFEDVGKGASKQKAVDRMTEFLAGAKIGNVYFMQNNVEYIGHLEHGTSQQAPLGMVELSLYELQAKYL
ncbi:MAG: hypothetical protein ACSHWQ_00020 [Spongiibacteraceae bacterium]